MDIKCPKCGEVQGAKESLKKEWDVIKTISVESICITYFRCKKCNKITVVQLDNHETLKVLDEISELLKYAYMCKLQKRTPKKKKSNKMKHANKRLNNLRKELVEKYSGNCKVTLEGEFVDLVVEMQEVKENN